MCVRLDENDALCWNNSFMCATLLNNIMLIEIRTDLPDSVPTPLHSNRCARLRPRVFEAWAVSEMAAASYSRAPISIINCLLSKYITISVIYVSIM